MNISLVNTYYPNQKLHTTFTSCAKLYNPKKITNLDIFSKNYIRTTSNIFRDDEDWDYLMKYILLNFFSKKQVNIYSLGCSDGSEPYTYALYLKSKLPKEHLKKFSQIIACDINPEMIRVAKSGFINLSPEDIRNIKKYVKNAGQYLQDTGDPILICGNVYTDQKSFKFSREITKMIKFKKSDILTEVKALEDDGNSVVNIRNVFPYLNNEYVDEILKNLSQKLKTGSMFVFGRYDHQIPNFRNRLHNLGFTSPVSFENFVIKM